jgi:hypothetical protein
METINQLKLSSPSHLLRSAVVFYRRHFSSIVLIVVVPPLLGLTLAEVLAPAYQWVGAVVLSLLNLIAQIILIELVHRRGELSFHAAGGRLRFLFRPFLWTSILAGFAGAGGFIALVVPGIIISVWLIFSSFLVVAEERRGLDALVESAGYVHGRFFTVFWYLLFYFLIAAVVSIALLVPISLLPFGDFISTILASIILSPVGTFYLFYLYHELKQGQAAHPVSPEVLASKRRFLQIFLGVGLVAALIFLVVLGIAGTWRLVTPWGQLGSVFLSLPWLR